MPSMASAAYAGPLSSVPLLKSRQSAQSMYGIGLGDVEMAESTEESHHMPPLCASVVMATRSPLFDRLVEELMFCLLSGWKAV